MMSVGDDQRFASLERPTRGRDDVGSATGRHASCGITSAVLRHGIADLGSNTARLIVYTYEPGKWFRITDGIRETVRLGDLGVARTTIREFEDATADAVARAQSPALKARAAELIAAHPKATTFGDGGLDETHAAMQEEMRRFSEAEVLPHAHEWHLANDYIPLETIEKLAELGVFGVSMPEEFGGLGLGKEAMCIVSEELSRGYIGVGSLGTRSEIAGELIIANGTDEQKQNYLPKIASGEILPTAVFTEPAASSGAAARASSSARARTGEAAGRRPRAPAKARSPRSAWRR